MANNLMNFRLAYLQAIPKVWNDEMLKGTADYKGLKDELCDTVKGVMPFLKKHCNYKNPWNFLKIVIIDQEINTWKVMETAGWSGPNNYYIIKLPTCPFLEEQPVALAKYYETFSTFFGPDAKKQSADASQSDSSSRRTGLPLDLGVGDQKFLEFGGLTLRAIALAWKNNDFYDDLVGASRRTNEEGVSQYNDATEILSKWLGYNNPWNFSISFQEDFDFTWNSEKGIWDNIPKNEIRLHYPNSPTQGQEYWPIALTSYNNTGPEYPFTCC